MRAIYIDSCIAIYAIEGSTELRKKIVELLLPTDRCIPRVAYTDLTRLECRVKPLSSNDIQLLAKYDNFFSTPGYEKLALTADVFDLATRLRADHKIKTPDALHLAAAIAAKCELFCTNDSRLARAAHNKIDTMIID